MKKFDDHEKKIIRELIRNPKISDNQIGRKSGIAVKTVNRKRKRIEERGLINYFCSVNHSATGELNSSMLVILSLKNGITRAALEDGLLRRHVMAGAKKHTRHVYLGEDQGKTSIILLLEASEYKELTEVLNARIIPELRMNYGEDCLIDVKTFNLTTTVRRMHNYMPSVNMANGVLKPDWPSEDIFVD